MRLPVCLVISTVILFPCLGFSNAEAPPKQQPGFGKTRDVISVEAGGRGGFYSVNYDRMLTDDVSLGAGTEVLLGPRLTSVFALLGHGNYYFGDPAAKRFFLTGGVSAIYVAALNEMTSIPSYPMGGSGSSSDLFSSRLIMWATIGAGFEVQSASGTVLRLTPYVLIGKRDEFDGGGLMVNPWFGISLGRAF